MAAASSPRLLLPLLPPLQIILLLFLAAKSSAQQTIYLVYCGNTNYTSPSAYESNLHALISNLTASTPNLPSLYSNITVGSNPSSQIYGLAQCRPDATPATCFDCLNRSAAAAAGDRVPIFGGGSGCPLRKSASLRADLCVLRYSDQRFFSKPEETSDLSLAHNANASDPDRFRQRVNDLMAEITPEAAKAESRFAVGVSNSSNLEDIYGMAWCTRDLYSDDCLLCLQQAIGDLESTSVGARVFLVSCSLRFETYAFFSQSPPSPPPPPQPAAPLPAAVGNDTGQENIGSAENFLFNLGTIRTATSNFSEENELGKGGFGPVYKVWHHWDQKMTLQIVDECLEDEYNATEALRCIQIGLLCVQNEPSQRPSMASVMLMFSSYSSSLPVPLMPGFYIRGAFSNEIKSQTSASEIEIHASNNMKSPNSENVISISDVEPR
ncbi:Cysteine-rich receptor-like protein kinase 8 [Apostasia shenzhenica]|uniref:Cysteine-rich receptor-like protein kinase 8 n=1 Tax=Apostasia shenzhenica TaxID=1088818 RepID=A0A2I0AA43_9ASPA|nr:Cysteine-rich receptor-like protein kinase 8 [Apostasia shenzhenica]